MKRLIVKLKKWVGSLKKQLVIIYLVSKDERTPWYANWLIYLTLAYALSPIDLIPDFIPVIGFLDDLLILPIGIYFSIKTIPKIVLEDAKKKAENYHWNKRKSFVGLVMVVLIWLVIAFLLFLKF